MSCCCQKLPRLRLRRQALFSLQVDWNDLGCPIGHSRLLRWHIRLDGALVWSSPWASPQDTLPLGSDSNYLHLNASAGQITAFLIGEGLIVNAGETICLQAQALNCQQESAWSNVLCFSASAPPPLTCDCDFVWAREEGLEGIQATPPPAFTASDPMLVFCNGLLNPLGEDFSTAPLQLEDQLAWIGLDDCPLVLQTALVLGQSGSVSIPPAFSGLGFSELMLFRNGLALWDFDIQGSTVQITDAPSTPADSWFFVRLAAGVCSFEHTVLSLDFSGDTLDLPQGYSTANASRWLLFINGLLQYPDWNYVLNNQRIELAQAAQNDAIHLLAIS